jgi:hypothetical protein
MMRVSIRPDIAERVLGHLILGLSGASEAEKLA